MERHTDALIIGGGPAGITFANALKKLRPEASITMLRPEPHSMVYCAIPYAIEGLFDASKVFKRDDIVTGIGVDLIHRAAVEVDLTARRIVDEAGDSHTADTIFIATGASPVRPRVPGIEAENVYTVKTQQDMEALIGRVVKGASRAVVVGAGAIGIEQAQAYASWGIDTYLLDRAPHVLPSMLDADMAEHVHQTLLDNKINLLPATEVAALATENDRVYRVDLAGGGFIDLDPASDFVCFAVGMKPDVALFEGQGLEMTADGIVVDDRMRTSLSGVYAAGDCCAGISMIDGLPIGGKLATNAVPMAKTAARNVAGRDDVYPGFVNGAATCAYDLKIGSTGFTEAVARRRGIETVAGWGETKTIFPMMPDVGDLRVKIVADRRNIRIVGGQTISALPVTDKTDILSLAIQQRMSLKDLAKLSYSAQPWQSFFPARNAIVEACEAALGNLAASAEQPPEETELACV